ncbi:uncharacterized protein EI90DRAFT_366202 [Cantharellus anzutake]|uniref:uncharacterized protein n=1 Tax=Cantharellus anzutake TaxID=1750568 RepID=UPI0019039110|nr:uncharacterized protein EI90DRAFT_366202 [Cantharellus anzutake]KAF8315079.1 hypothetical protein EI90DRAFT_366202 [Cantharellus anzutake]
MSVTMTTALVSFILTQSIHAAPISQHPPPNSTAFSINYSDACNDLRHCRTMWSIVYSCLLTIFACVWTAIHPDLFKQHSLWEPQPLSSRKIQMMMTLVLPEVVVMVAWTEFSTAWKISKKIHSYFVTMGGFFDSFTQEVVELHESQDPSTFFEKYPGIIDKSGNDRKVAVTREQILDRSKGNFFAKSIIVLQLLWFTIHILLCALWWHKPLDVHFPIHVTEETHPNPLNSDAITDQVLPANPTSFAAKIVALNPAWILGITGVVFGGVHCLAWSFPFPTRAEKLLWRIFAIIITVSPGPFAWAMGKGRGIHMSSGILSAFFFCYCSGYPVHSHIYVFAISTPGPLPNYILDVFHPPHRIV